MDCLSNFVCQSCWQITDAFHELYLKSKNAQEKFFNPMIKVEVDTTELWPESSERDFVEIPPFDDNDIKLEPVTGSVNSIKFKLRDF